MKVVIEGRGIKREITTDENGEYEFDLPAGIYNITTGQGWYYPLKRASFRIRPDATARINIYPAIRLLSIGIEVTDSGVREPATYAKPPKYDALQLLPAASIDLVVEYDKKRILKGIVEYKYAKMSYDALTVSAEILLFDKKNHRIEARGNILIDNNGQRRRMKSLSIDLRNGVLDILSSLDVANNGEPNNSFNASGWSLIFIRKIGGLVRFFPPR